MSKRKLFSRDPVSASSLIRHVILGWLLAVTIEYLLLPEAVRNLSNLNGLAKMSLTRVGMITCGVAALLTGISCVINTRLAERWCMVAVFGVLSFAVLRASASWAFFAVCSLVMIALVVFAVRGWNSSAEPDPCPEKPRKRYLWITAGLAVAFFLFVILTFRSQGHRLLGCSFKYLL